MGFAVSCNENLGNCFDIENYEFENCFGNRNGILVGIYIT